MTTPGENRKGGGEFPERELWEQVTQGVKPLKRRSPRLPPEPEAVATAAKTGPCADRSGSSRPAADRRSSSPAPVRNAPAAPPELAPGVAAGLDKRTLARLRRGLIAPQGRIDLHNLTQSEAHGALTTFIAKARAADKRCVLVITGKGTRSEGAIGVLRANVPHWLNQPPNRPHILAFSYAAAADGGEGALYVLLRRQRNR
jgi:DNA-nicking Smr family endonuclease